jgi:hypothetical protein
MSPLRPDECRSELALAQSVRQIDIDTVIFTVPRHARRSLLSVQEAPNETTPAAAACRLIRRSRTSVRNEIAPAIAEQPIPGQLVEYSLGWGGLCD